MHIVNNEAYLVPYVDSSKKEPTLEPWPGYGANHLFSDMDAFPPAGYLQTRVEVILKITKENKGRSPTGRKSSWSRVRDKLNKFGLDATPFDDTDFYESDIFLSSPCFIHVLGSGHPDLGKITPSKLPKTNPKTNPNRVDTSWIGKVLLDMYPDQTLHTEQKDAIEHSIGTPGSLTTAILPTGLGKTRIAQSLAISLTRGHGDQKSSEGPVLIVYPTISLLDDQKGEWDVNLKEDMTRLNLDPLRVRVIHSGADDEYVDEIDSLLLKGELDAVLCSPERLLPKRNKIGMMGVAARLGGSAKGKPFSALIIDETHIIYDWGESIRPAFHLIPQIDKTLRQINPNLRTLLMTATLTPREEEDLIRRLDGKTRSVKKVRRATIREDLAFTLIKKGFYDIEPLAEEVWDEFINHHKWRKEPPRSNSPLLIYTSRVQSCKDIAEKIRPRVPKRWETYNGSTTKTARTRALKRFQDDDIDLMVATSAFGMGVNKPDVWLIGYVGKPPTVRELYQSFGRAARGSKWSKQGTQTRLNGNCIALISNQHKKIPTKPIFKPPKLMERFWPMIAGGGQTGNGYVLLSLTTDTRQIFWDPYDESKQRTKLSKEEDNKKQQLIKDSQNHNINIGAELDAWWNLRYDKLLQQREKNEFIRRISAAIYAELGGYLRILGTYPGNPIISEDSRSLREMLEQGGHARVLEAYGEIGKTSSVTRRWGTGPRFNSDDSSLYLVAEVIKEIDGFEGYMSSFQEGQNVTREWNEYYSNELKEFLDSDECIRKRFAPIVGTDPTTETSCVDHFNQNQNDPLPSGEPPLVPCSVCRQELWPDTDPLHATGSNLRFDGHPPYSTWLDFNSLEYLAGRTISTPKPQAQTFDGAANNLPYDGFVCGFKFHDGEGNLHHKNINQKWFDLWSEFGNDITFSKIFDVDGKQINQSDFSITLVDLHSTAIVRVKLDPSPGEKFPYGGLIYKQNNILICRLLTKQDSIAAFNKIRSLAPDRNSYDELPEIFIGRNKPDIYGLRKSEHWGT